MTNEQRLNYLIESFYRGTLTSAEEQELNNWFHSFSQDDMEYPDEELMVQSRLFVRLMENSGYVTKRNRVLSLRRWYTAAASIVLFLAGGLAYYYTFRETNDIVSENRIVVNGKLDIKSGGNTAQLILEDGSAVDLDTIFGAIKMNGNIEYPDGSSVSTSRSKDEELLASSNLLKLKTPKAGQYRIQLSDGTVVWMNAATVLTYPKAFRKDRREVELEGEAYFEVAHDTDRPFIVRGNKQSVQVLGTKFNIANYSGRPKARTTLISGSVRIHTEQGDRLLQPGQEATVSDKGLIVKEVYAEDAIAWKNGKFLFDNERLADVMDKISDWYDIRIEFKNENLKSEKIFAVVSRYENISVVLSKIEATGVASFTIANDKIQVLPFQKL